MNYIERLIWGIIIVIALGFTLYRGVLSLTEMKKVYNEYVECVKKPISFEMFKRLSNGEKVLLLDRACNSGNGGSYE